MCQVSFQFSRDCTGSAEHLPEDNWRFPNLTCAVWYMSHPWRAVLPLCFNYDQASWAVWRSRIKLAYQLSVLPLLPLSMILPDRPGDQSLYWVLMILIRQIIPDALGESIIKSLAVLFHYTCSQCQVCRAQLWNLENCTPENLWNLNE